MAASEVRRDGVFASARGSKARRGQGRGAELGAERGRKRSRALLDPRRAFGFPLGPASATVIFIKRASWCDDPTTGGIECGEFESKESTPSPWARFSQRSRTAFPLPEGLLAPSSSHRSSSASVAPVDPPRPPTLLGSTAPR
ncbi:hypothetical protein KM043_000517 [Ampulex compressa]|nr:hypothetical protein KM043_000517 [Ampulex compressa]